MAYSSWTNPPSRHFRSGRGGYSMGGGPQTSISALQTISNPASVASIASPVMPSSELPFSTQPATESIAAATRAPGPKRYTGTPIVTGEKETGGLVPGLQHPAGSGMPGAYGPTGTTLTGVPLPSLPGMPGPAGMPGMPGSFMLPTVTAGLPSPTGTTPSGHIIPKHLYGNPGAVAALKRSGLSYDEWERTIDASNYI